jgi:hypothetical protein
MFVIICLQITPLQIYVDVYNRMYFNTNFHNPRASVSLAVGINTKTNNNFCKTVTLLLSLPQKHSLNKSPMTGRNILPYQARN